MVRARRALEALAPGLLAFGVYLRTLYPGLVGDGDTPKFQYVGAVLGTPHNPGYPLYLLVSHVFSRLPFGNLAWRINLLSAVAAAVAVALLFAVQRRLGVARGPAAAAALAAGFGPVFWSQAILAEVYAPGAALLLAVIAATLAWGVPADGAPRREKTLLAAIGLAALALGHHLTIVCVAPALVVYALAVDRRAALRPRVLLGGAGLVALGLAQYLLILVRTRQGAPYLGSRAANLAELLDVVRGAQFAERLFAFDVRTLVLERLPLVARLFHAELGTAGCLLACAGVLLLARRRPREALLLGLGAAGVVAFVLNYKVDDTGVFLVPAFVLAWPCVGVALDTLLVPLRRTGAAARHGRARRARAAGALAALVPFLLPLHQLVTHFRARDHHGRTFEMRYFRAVFEALPSGSVVLAETYTVDQMVLYEILGEGYGARKGVRLVTRDPESVHVYAGRGLPVFAFGRAHAELVPLGFRFTRVPLYGHAPDAAGGRFAARQPFPRGAFPLYELRGLPECLALGDGAWRDVTVLARDGRLLARLDNFEPGEARLELHLWDGTGLPRAVRVAGHGRPEVTRHAAAARGAPERVELRVDDRGVFAALRLDFAAPPRRLEARAVVDRAEAERARLCRLAPGDE